MRWMKQLGTGLVILACSASGLGCALFCPSKPAVRYCLEIPPEVAAEVLTRPDSDPVAQFFYRYSVDCGWVQ